MDASRSRSPLVVCSRNTCGALLAASSFTLLGVGGGMLGHPRGEETLHGRERGLRCADGEQPGGGASRAEVGGEPIVEPDAARAHVAKDEDKP